MSGTVSAGQFAGYPCVSFALPCGDSVQVALQGAQVLSWVSGGRERLYLSPAAAQDGHSAIRGGVPVCFPQFNERGSLPKHGFFRNQAWRQASVDGIPANAEVLIQQSAAGVEQGTLCLALSDDAASRSVWPHPFAARLVVHLARGVLRVTLAVRNTGDQPLAFSGALHTYLAVDDIGQTRLGGLGGQREWDSVSDLYGQGSDTLVIEGEFDRVYDAASGPLLLQDGAHSLQLRQSASWANTVVWNPGVKRGALVPDLPPEGYLRMLCVEAAQVFSPISVAAGQSWQGWQELRAV